MLLWIPRPPIHSAPLGEEHPTHVVTKCEQDPLQVSQQEFLQQGFHVLPGITSSTPSSPTSLNLSCLADPVMLAAGSSSKILPPCLPDPPGRVEGVSTDGQARWEHWAGWLDRAERWWQRLRGAGATAAVTGAPPPPGAGPEAGQGVETLAIRGLCGWRVEPRGSSEAVRMVLEGGGAREDQAHVLGCRGGGPKRLHRTGPGRERGWA